MSLHSKLCVAVIGSQSPDRTMILSGLLSDLVARSGWGERIEVLTGGFGDGVGRTTGGIFVTLGLVDVSGPAEEPINITDIENDHGALDKSDSVIVTTGDDADWLISWPALEGKQVYALTDFVCDDSWAIVDPAAPLDDYAAQVAESVPLLLRALIARPA